MSTSCLLNPGQEPHFGQVMHFEMFVLSIFSLVITGDSNLQQNIKHLCEYQSIQMDVLQPFMLYILIQKHPSQATVVCNVYQG